MVGAVHLLSFQDLDGNFSAKNKVRKVKISEQK
jgi:hypothetical protein